MALVEDVNYASIDAATVEVGPLIGSGEFAKVYLGRLGDGARVAVKRQVAPSEEECDEAAQVARALGLELRILASVDHVNVLRYVGCWEDVGRPSVDPKGPRIDLRGGCTAVVLQVRCAR